MYHTTFGPRTISLITVHVRSSSCNDQNIRRSNSLAAFRESFEIFVRRSGHSYGLFFSRSLEGFFPRQEIASTQRLQVLLRNLFPCISKSFFLLPEKKHPKENFSLPRLEGTPLARRDLPDGLDSELWIARKATPRGLTLSP